jgi:trans-aconitate 2-methyltransferase
MTDVSDVSDYYDGYAERQIQVGINARHRAIVATMAEAGWRPGQRVLEIGTGIGTLTELIAEGLGPQGSLVGVDLSPQSIEIAKHRLRRFAHVDVMAADALDVAIEGSFDVIVLPDVIEHIPLELHERLFRRLAGWLCDDGIVVMNYPSPYYLAWCHAHRPDLLQVIDQPIYADVLIPHIYASGLYVHRMETYSLWIREGDYVRMVLHKQASAATFTELPENPPSLYARAAGRLRRLVRNRRFRRIHVLP